MCSCPLRSAETVQTQTAPCTAVTEKLPGKVRTKLKDEAAASAGSLLDLRLQRAGFSCGIFVLLGVGDDRADAGEADERELLPGELIVPGSCEFSRSVQGAPATITAIRQSATTAQQYENKKVSTPCRSTKKSTPLNQNIRSVYIE